ncbi:hypothetical protein BC629DRAFT_1438875 [Irpex lacteus]|nr:hypothetical protein BC629DRAFT_1438875 [Irpex lacteus]
MGVPGLWNAIREAGVPRSLTSIAVVDGFQSASSSASTSSTSTSTSTLTSASASSTSRANSHASPNPRPHPRAFRIGIDASIWFVHAEYGKEGENPELRTIFFRLTRLLQVPYLPLFVFDGPLRPAMKRGKLIDTKPNWMIDGLKGMIEAFGFEWRTAPGEAEAELAYLNRIGVIDAVLTDDVDTLVFGASQSKNLSGNRAHDLTNADGRDDKNHTMTFSAQDIARHPNISLDTPSLILIALLSGGDYSPGIPGCGISVSASLAQAGFGRSLVSKVQSLSLSISLGLQSSSSSSSGGSSGSRTAKTKTSKTRVTLGTSEKEELLTWLESWREELCKELRTNSRGFLKKRMPALASRIEREKWVPDLQVLMAYVCPVTSEERAVAKALLSLSSSSSSLQPSTAEVVERAKKQIADELRTQYVWKHDPDIGAIARVCEDRFEWGVREVILKRFRSWLWVGVVCRMLRRASINLDLDLLADERGGEGEGGGGEGEGREGRSSTPLPSSSQRTETAKRLESLVMSSPRKGTSRRPLVSPLSLSHSPDDSDSDFDTNSNSNEGGKVILKIHSSRTHASTDGLLEYRLEVDPSGFVRAVEEGIEGKRSVARSGWTDSEDEGEGGGGGSSSDPESSKKTGKKGGKGGGKKEDPREPVRMWMPACMVERVVPGLVREFEERCAKKSSKSKTSSATKASSTTAKGKAKAKAPPRAKSTTAIPSSSQLSSSMTMVESSDEEDEEDDSVPMPITKPKPRPRVRKAATAPSGSTRPRMMEVSDDGGKGEGDEDDEVF